jgi:hypothetical protein
MTKLIGIDNLAREMAAKYDIDQAAAYADTNAYADQISDDPELYGYDEDDGGAVTEAGAEIIRAQMATVYENDNFEQQAQDAVVKLQETTARVKELDTAQDDRDTAIRHALQVGLPVRVIHEHTGLSRERVYQIRDKRR